MKRALLIFTILFAAGVAIADDFGSVIDSFTAHTNGDAISLDWRSAVESGVVSYSIERSDVKTSDFQSIGSVAASGNYTSYHFTDSRVSGIAPSGQGMPATAASDLYKYRLCINYSNAISYSQTIYVSRPASGVRRTWGMIKEMFH
jgi:hypothetical protein